MSKIYKLAVDKQATLEDDKSEIEQLMGYLDQIHDDLLQNSSQHSGDEKRAKRQERIKAARQI
jgi:hypothetical protein